MHERIFLKDGKLKDGTVRFEKGAIYGPYPQDTWDKIAESLHVKGGIDKIATRVDERAVQSVTAAA